MTTDQREARRHQTAAALAGLVLGLLVELVAIVAAVVSAGAGHGDYVFARILFPVPFLLVPIRRTFGLPSICLALVQFPLYGVVVARGRAIRSYRLALAVIGLHVVAALACFSGLLSRFVG